MREHLYPDAPCQLGIKRKFRIPDPEDEGGVALEQHQLRSGKHAHGGERRRRTAGRLLETRDPPAFSFRERRESHRITIDSRAPLRRRYRCAVRALRTPARISPSPQRSEAVQQPNEGAHLLVTHAANLPSQRGGTGFSYPQCGQRTNLQTSARGQLRHTGWPRSSTNSRAQKPQTSARVPPALTAASRGGGSAGNPRQTRTA